MRIAFIGLGHIGKPMAMMWLQSNLTMLVYDAIPSATRDLVSAGAEAASSVAALACAAQVIGICVRDDEQVESVLSGPHGILENAKEGTVVLVHSTVRQDSILKWHKRGFKKKMKITDASVTRALAPNTFCYMVGGDAQLVNRVKPLLAAGGNTVLHAGPVGSGIALKLCNNMLTYASFVAAHEAYKLAKAFGLDPEMLHKVSAANGVLTPITEALIRGREAAEREGGKPAVEEMFAPHGANGTKDMRAALVGAKHLGVSMPGAEKTAQLIAEALLNGY